MAGPDPTQGLTDDQMAAQFGASDQGLTDDQMAAQFGASDQGLTDDQMAAQFAKPQAETPLATGVREAAHSAIPAAGGMAAMGYGAAQGAELGAPFGPVGAAIGGIGGALVAGVVAGGVMQKASSLVERALGVDDEAQRQVNREENPWSAIAGETAPWAMGFRPSAQLALKARALTGAGMGGFSAAQQYVETGEVDPKEVATQAAFGAVADKPYGVGKKLLAVGERFSVPLRTARGTSESPPPPTKVDTSQNPAPATRDSGNEGVFAKDITPPEGSEAVVQRGDIQPEAQLAIKGKPLTPENTETLQRSLEATDLKPPSEDQKAVETPKTPPVKVPAEMAEETRPERDFSEGPIAKDAVPPVEEETPPSKPAAPTQEAIRVAAQEHVAALHGEEAPPKLSKAAESLGWRGLDDGTVEPTSPTARALQTKDPQRFLDVLADRETRIGKQPPAAQAAIAGERPPTKAALALQAKQEAAAKAAGEAFPQARVITPEEKAAKKLVVPGRDPAQKLLDAREDLDPGEKQRIQNVLDAGTPAQIKAEYTKLRNKANRKMVPGTNVQANDAKDLARKVKAVEAIKVSIEDAVPAEHETPEALKTRLETMWDTAVKANGGKDPLKAYPSREKPAAYELLQEARSLLDSDMSHEKILEYEGNELTVRKALEEDPNAKNVLGTRGIESAASLQGEEPNYETSLAGQTLHEAQTAAEEEATKNLTKNVLDDDNPYDLTTKEGVAKVRADTAKVIPNLIKSLDEKALKSSQPQWWRDTDESAAKTARLKRAREAAANVERGYREPPVADKEHFEKAKGEVYKGEEGDIAQKALDDYKAKQAKVLPEPAGYAKDLATREARALENTPDASKRISPEARRIMEQKEEADPSIAPKEENLADRFLNDVRGSGKIPTVNIPAVNAAMKAQGSVLRAGLRKYLGAVFSDNERITKSVLTQMVTHAIGLRSDFRNIFDADWHVMNKTLSKPEFYTFMDVLEKHSPYTEAISGVGPHQFDKPGLVKNLVEAGIDAKKADMLADRSPVIRDQLDQMWSDDAKYGSTADYVKNYVPHIFSAKKINGQTAEAWINARNEGQPKSVGSTTHQQERVFDTIQAAEAHGFELRYKNVYDLLSARYAASVEFHTLIGGLRRLQELGLAVPSSEAKGPQKQWKERGGEEYNAPDHNAWIIHPDAVPLWKNAEDARGLRNAGNTLGSMYRTWMKLKNVWVPIELSMTAFHAVHVLGINFAENLTGAVHEFGKTGDLGVFKTALKNSATQPLLMLPLEHLPFGLGKKYADSTFGQAHMGARADQMVQWWNKPPAERTAGEKMWQRLYDAGGMIPRQPAEERIIGEHELARSLANSQYLKAAPEVVRLGIQKASGGMFTQWIPDLKNAAYQNAVDRALRLDPTLLNDTIKRNEVLRSIGNDIHSRYGEMNYKTLFWHPILRDAGVGSFLSLSWQLGQVNQLAGAAHGLVMRAGGKSMERLGAALGDTALQQAGKERQGTRLQSKLYEHSTKGTYVTTYVGTSMMFAGLMSYMLSGKSPTNMDYFYPRNGNTNPDGTPGRYTSPFNTREGPMLKGHIEATDSVYEGIKELLYNKMVIQPLVELATNRDHFGNEMYSPHSPAYKQALQALDSELGRRINPISLTGAARAKQLGGGLKDQIAAFAGFGPAPAYANKPVLDAQIGELYKQHAAPEKRPYEVSGTGLVKNLVGGPSQAQIRSDAKAAKYLARAKGDTEAEGAANDKLLGTGISPITLKKLQPGEDSQYFFSRLPPTDQLDLIQNKMTPENFAHYVLQNRAITGKMARSKLIQAWTTRNVNQ